MAPRSVEPNVGLPPFQSLLDDHGDAVYRFLRASVGATDADDCYQETWIAAMRAYPSLTHARNLRSWLFTIASRKAIDHHRVRRHAPLPSAELPEPAGQDIRPDREVWTAVRELPPKQKLAVALRYAADADYALIATTMEISEDAARRNVHEGLKRLRAEYQR